MARSGRRNVAEVELDRGADHASAIIGGDDYGTIESHFQLPRPILHSFEKRLEIPYRANGGTPPGQNRPGSDRRPSFGVCRRPKSDDHGMWPRCPGSEPRIWPERRCGVEPARAGTRQPVEAVVGFVEIRRHPFDAEQYLDPLFAGAAEALAVVPVMRSGGQARRPMPAGPPAAPVGRSLHLFDDFGNAADRGRHHRQPAIPISNQPQARTDPGSRRAPRHCWPARSRQCRRSGRGTGWYPSTPNSTANHWRTGRLQGRRRRPADKHCASGRAGPMPGAGHPHPSARIDGPNSGNRRRVIGDAEPTPRAGARFRAEPREVDPVVDYLRLVRGDTVLEERFDHLS